MNTKISFTTHENPARQGAKKGPCIGYIKHNGILGGDSLAAALAQRTGYTDIQARAFVGALADVVTEGLASGNAIDFGPFQLRLSIKGTFPAANASFDPAENCLEVFAVPSKALIAVLAKLSPENATPMGKPWIYEIACNSRKKAGEIVLGEAVTVNGQNIRIDSEQDDEGIWLESDAGERLAAATIVKTESGHATCKFAKKSVEPGPYRLAIYTRDGGAASGQVAAIRRKVKVVA